MEFLTGMSCFVFRLERLSLPPGYGDRQSRWAFWSPVQEFWGETLKRVENQAVTTRDF